jgi:hypothetical protein
MSLTIWPNPFSNIVWTQTIVLCLYTGSFVVLVKSLETFPPYGSDMKLCCLYFALVFYLPRLKALLISLLLMGQQRLTEQLWILLFFGHHWRILRVQFKSYPTDYASVQWKAGLGGKGDCQWKGPYLLKIASHLPMIRLIWNVKFWTYEQKIFWGHCCFFILLFIKINNCIVSKL